MPLTNEQIRDLAEWLVKYAEDLEPDELREVIVDPRFVPAVNSALDEEESRRGEAAEQRRIEEFYGGDGPVTQDEHHRKAWAEKRGHRSW